ncbi:MAG: hypothetical protein ACJ75H_01215 [Thermoanaerobaculia bacterium]
MAGVNLARWRRLAATLAFGSWIALGCGSTAPRRPVSGVGLDEGPTRWLMLPEEARKYRRLRTTREVVDFVEEFWRRRDPDPGRPGSPSAVQTQTLSVESWVYPLEELTPRLRQLLEEDGAPPEVVVVFATDSRHTYMVDGEEYLEMAAKASIRQ